MIYVSKQYPEYVHILKPLTLALFFFLQYQGTDQYHYVLDAL